MVFCNMYKEDEQIIINFVTILILIDGFLQFIGILSTYMGNNGHNPYFSRWFSAMDKFGVTPISVKVSQSLF